MSKTKKMILSAMLLAVSIILSRFISIKTQLLVISLNFIPIMLAGIWLGPKYSTLIAALSDLIGALLFPFGTYFPGFTLSAAITGLIYGLFLYKKSAEVMKDSKFIIRLIISSLLALGIVGLLITPLWLHILYGSAFIVAVSSRIITQLIMLPIQVVTIFLLDKSLRPITNKYLY